MDNQKGPLIGIVIGSASDYEKIGDGLKILENFKVPFEFRVISAHRTPDIAADYGKSAKARGLKIILACAGLSAALPGVLASYTHIPVIGVPIDSGSLKGVDALLSIVQMPPGIPVAGVGIDSFVNAVLFALGVLALDDPFIQEQLVFYRKDMADKVREHDSRVKR